MQQYGLLTELLPPDQRYFSRCGSFMLRYKILSTPCYSVSWRLKPPSVMFRSLSTYILPLKKVQVLSFPQAPKRGCPRSPTVIYSYTFRVLLDFERAQSYAFGLVFGEGIHRQGCFFYFRQANLIWIKNKHPALWAWLYALKGNHSRCHLLNRFIALAFLKVAECILGFIKLCESPWFTENVTLLNPMPNTSKLSGLVKPPTRKTAEEDKLSIG